MIIYATNIDINTRKISINIDLPILLIELIKTIVIIQIISIIIGNNFKYIYILYICPILLASFLFTNNKIMIFVFVDILIPVGIIIFFIIKYKVHSILIKQILPDMIMYILLVILRIIYTSNNTQSISSNKSNKTKDILSEDNSDFITF